MGGRKKDRFHGAGGENNGPSAGESGYLEESGVAVDDGAAPGCFTGANQQKRLQQPLKVKRPNPSTIKRMTFFRFNIQALSRDAQSANTPQAIYANESKILKARI